MAPGRPAESRQRRHQIRRPEIPQRLQPEAGRRAEHAQQSLRAVLLGSEATTHDEKPQPWNRGRGIDREEIRRAHPFHRGSPQTPPPGSRGFNVEAEDHEKAVWREKFGPASLTVPPMNLIPILAVGCFGGGFPEKSTRMTWDMVDFKRKHIDLPAEITKDGDRRIVDLPDNRTAGTAASGNRSSGNRARPRAPHPNPARKLARFLARGAASGRIDSGHYLRGGQLLVGALQAVGPSSESSNPSRNGSGNPKTSVLEFE